MIYRVLCILSVLLFSFDGIHAQQLNVRELKAVPNDPAATQYAVKDRNEHNCALVIVNMVVDGARFEGNIIRQERKANGEYWVYVTEGTMDFTIYTKDYLAEEVEFRKFGIRDLQSGCTYKMTVERPEYHPVPVAVSGAIAVGSTPQGAGVSIDGKTYGITPLTVSDLAAGTHTVVVSKDGYEQLSRQVTVKGDETARLDATLTPRKTLSEKTSGEDRVFMVSNNGKIVTFRMKCVRAGEFVMGCTLHQDEGPTRRVTLTHDYYIGETEVTQELWYAVMGESPTQAGPRWDESQGLGDDYPAYYISYDDCQVFLQRLFRLTGCKFRLPTEAEWEFAARDREMLRRHYYAGSDLIDEVGWCSRNTHYSAMPVGKKKPNSLGLYDMTGNLYEWCSDWYDTYDKKDLVNPAGPSDGTFRVMRGGGWGNAPMEMLTTCRNKMAPSGRSMTIGLRLAF